MELAVAALAADEYGCGHYRVINPIKTLAACGVRAELFSTVNVAQLGEFNVILAQRQVHPNVRKALEQLAQRGKLIVTEIDDILERTHPSNPAYSFYHNGTPDLMNYLAILGNSNGLICSTEALRDHYMSRNANSIVIPNVIDYNLRTWPVYEPPTDGTIKIGWTGSTSHVVDLDMIGPVIKTLMDKYSHLRYTHYSNRDMLETWVAKWGIDLDRCDFIEPVDFAKYPSNLAKFDIGIAPLMMEGFASTFNRCRSYLKPMEYNAVGIPFVATNQASYIRYVQGGGQGFTVGPTSEWIDKLSLLIEDNDLRLAMGAKGLEHVHENHDIVKGIHKYIDAWNYLGTNINTAKVVAVSTKVGRNDPCPCGCGRKAKKCETWGAWGL